MALSFHLPAGASLQEGSRFALGVLVAVLLASACGGDATRDIRLSPTHTVVVGTAAFSVELAVAPAERSTGLGNHAPLKPSEGMLFVFPEPARETFWMKNVSYPLDFIWISEGRRVVEVTLDVPPDDGSKLALYKSQAEIQYMLEIGGGRTTELGIAVGDAVTVQPEIDFDEVS